MRAMGAWGAAAEAAERERAPPAMRAVGTWEAAAEAAAVGKQKGWAVPAKTDSYGRKGEGRAIRGAPTLGGAKELGTKGAADAFKAAGNPPGEETAKGATAIELPEATSKGAGKTAEEPKACGVAASESTVALRVAGLQAAEPESKAKPAPEEAPKAKDEVELEDI